MQSSVRVAPSILAADFANLSTEVRSVESAVSMLHVDVMDGHFVPNISLGPPVIASLRAATSLYLDCHLMITDPLSYLEPIAKAGADGVTVHIEAVPNPVPVFKEAEMLGLDVGLVINPPTPETGILRFLERCSMVVVMSVHPGFGGQSFISQTMPKVAALRESIDSAALATDIQVDGGINSHTARIAAEAGATILVAGTSVFRTGDAAAAVREILANATGEVE
jgi:ribulose-phosphate 3-epimerase